MANQEYENTALLPGYFILLIDYRQDKKSKNFSKLPYNS